jgi:hypothetical protein
MTTTQRDLARTVAQEVGYPFLDALALVAAGFAGLQEKLIPGIAARGGLSERRPSGRPTPGSGG